MRFSSASGSGHPPPECEGAHLQRVEACACLQRMETRVRHQQDEDEVDDEVVCREVLACSGDGHEVPGYDFQVILVRKIKF